VRVGAGEAGRYAEGSGRGRGPAGEAVRSGCCLVAGVGRGLVEARGISGAGIFLFRTSSSIGAQDTSLSFGEGALGIGSTSCCDLAVEGLE
jgi:hypothetical protein